MNNNTVQHDTSINGSGATHRPDGAAADIFSDLASLRLSPDEAGQIGSEEVLAHVSVRRPSANEFVRVNPDTAMSLATSVYIDAERETYFVAPGVRDSLVSGVKPVLLVPAVSQRGLFFIWPVALGDGTGRRNGTRPRARPWS